MISVSTRLKAFLDRSHVAYEALHHRRDYTAQETAADTHTKGIRFAKTVVVQADGEFAMAVLPAHHVVDAEGLRSAIGASQLRLADEVEFSRLFPDCEVGAEPPFGNLYDMKVYLSQAMLEDEHITFNAGSHEDAVRMKMEDYCKLVQPQVLDFSVAVR